MSMQIKRRNQRVLNELKEWNKNPPSGISCWKSAEQESNLSQLSASLVGPENTPYADGVFKLDIQIPDLYPIEPPQVTFRTKVYHPNIDCEGRICLDILKKPPSGNWKPFFNLSLVLRAIKDLLKTPNPDDPLVTDIAREIRCNPLQYDATAKDWTKRYASQDIEKNTNN